ncbi:MAG: carotenoid biosynthesis protein [Nonlabens sp.]
MAKKLALGFLWLIHVSAIVGIAMGYEDFFLPKSPFTLVYLFFMAALYIPLDSPKKLALFSTFFITGFVVEWIGVHSGWLFGDYYYGKNFGPKIDGIPILIGINWGLLTLCSHIIAKKLNNNFYFKAAIGASLMVLLDFFLEQICDYAGFWHFNGGAGIYNYICWWIIAFILHLVAGKARLKGDFTTSFHLYIVQLLFAAALWILILI